jgi:hypothetical protein
MSKLLRAALAAITKNSKKRSNQATKQALEIANLSLTQEYVYRSLEVPVTDQELAVIFKQTASAPNVTDTSIRSRRADLVKLGLVEETGERRKTSSGRKARVWQRTKI